MPRSGLSLINAEEDRAWMVIGFLLAACTSACPHGLEFNI
ncbi:hypothetical protein SynROS8604_02635 [Synechococcus sp. ROS8604]|nr:hypothetical protein SynROS8604_02635 [Synechococcus sp. ROS8604]